MQLTVFSVTAQRGGKITKSATATPGVSDLAVKTVKMEGSYIYEKHIFSCWHIDTSTYIPNLQYDQTRHY
jgi:hypothetical protein